MLYQATRQFGDFDNGIEIPHGAYVETDCVKWVERIGVFLRPLQNGETPKATVKIFKVTKTIEDSLPVDESPLVEDEAEVVEDENVEEVQRNSNFRRKLKPAIRKSNED